MLNFYEANNSQSHGVYFSLDPRFDGWGHRCHRRCLSPARRTVSGKPLSFREKPFLVFFLRVIFTQNGHFYAYVSSFLSSRNRRCLLVCCAARLSNDRTCRHRQTVRDDAKRTSRVEQGQGIQNASERHCSTRTGAARRCFNDAGEL